MKKILVAIFLAIMFLFVVGFLLAGKAIYSPTKEIPTQKQPEKIFEPASLDWDEEVASAPWQGRDSHATAVFEGKIWVMGGLDGTTRLISPGNIDYGNAPHFSDVWSSSDGKEWNLVLSKAPWGEKRSIQVVDFKGKMWLMGGWGPEVGYNNKVWSSKNGSDWKLETSSAGWPAREGHQLLVFKDKIWLIGGVKYSGQKLFNDVWFSEDGKSWEKATNNAGWDPRWDFSSTVFDNKIWVMGGMAFGDKIFNDIWSSEDGVTWSLVNKNPPFGTRQGSAMIDYKENLWVLGRLNIPLYGNGPNDIWYSKDGINWLKTNTNPGWTGREDGGAIVFKDKIWIVGGMDKNWKWRNDVWSSKSNLDISF